MKQNKTCSNCGTTNYLSDTCRNCGYSLKEKKWGDYMNIRPKKEVKGPQIEMPMYAIGSGYPVSSVDGQLWLWVIVGILFGIMFLISIILIIYGRYFL